MANVTCLQCHAQFTRYNIEPDMRLHCNWCGGWQDYPYLSFQIDFWDDAEAEVFRDNIMKGEEQLANQYNITKYKKPKVPMQPQITPVSMGMGPEGRIIKRLYLGALYHLPPEGTEVTVTKHHPEGKTKTVLVVTGLNKNTVNGRILTAEARA